MEPEGSVPQSQDPATYTQVLKSNDILL